MDSHEMPGHALARGAAAELDLRVQQLDDAVARVRQVQRRLEDSEDAFRRVMQDCGGLLQGVLTVEQMVELNKRLGRIVDESAQRLGSFEERVTREWSVLKQQYEEPLQVFREHALELRQTSLEAARSAALARQIVEQSFTALASPPAALTGVPAPIAPVEPWSLDDVTRVHQDVRAAQRDALLARAPEPADSPPLAPSAADPPSLGSIRLTRTLWLSAAAILFIGVTGLFAYTVQMRNQMAAVDSRLSAAAAQLAETERKTDAARQLAERQIEDARRTAQRAQAIASIVAAPDLRRIDLQGRPSAPGAYAQALASRSRGFLLNASRLPAPPPGKTYQVWAVSSAGATSLGAFAPGDDGSGSLLIESALLVPRLATVIVSLEDAGGAPQPSGAIYLAQPPRLPEPQP